MKKPKKKRRKVEQFPKRSFLKEVIKIHLNSLFPRTYTKTFFLDQRRNYVEVIEISKCWLGVCYKSESYILAHRKKREEFLRKLLESGELTGDEFKKYMPQKNEACIDPAAP